MIRTLLCRKCCGTFIFLFSGIFLLSGVAFAQTQLPNVKLFTTGGTIQSVGDHRQKLMEYSAGKVGPVELINDLPELKKIANITRLNECFDSRCIGFLINIGHINAGQIL